MVGTHLTAIDSILLTHDLLDKGVTTFTLHRLTTKFPADRLGVPDQTRVVDNLFSRMLAQKCFCQQPDNIVALNKFALLIEQKTTVKIPIPGQAKIGTRGLHQITGVMATLWQQRVWNTVGKLPVRIMVHLDQLKGQKAFQRIEHRTGSTIAGIDDDFQRTKFASLHIR